MVIFAYGDDVPGIGSAITKVLFTRNCNIDNFKMTALESCVSMIIAIHAPSTLSKIELEEALKSALEAFELNVKILDSKHTYLPEDDREEWIPYKANMICADRMGLLYFLMREMSRLDINIIDVKCAPLEEDPTKTFQVTVKIQVPIRITPETLRQTMDDLSRQLNVLIDIDPIEGLEV
jgi:glycine cleavage system regulatory protein